MSTPTKNIVLIGYFSKRTDLIAILTCSLAGFLLVTFLTHISGGFLAETPSKCPFVPSIAITSENFGFWQGFSVFIGGCGDLVLLVSVYPDFSKKMFSGNFSHDEKKYISDFFLMIKFSRNFFAGSKSLFIE
ncbi:MAG: hypothetical protein Q7V05_14195 [Methanoregula sp.]|nr:hypothetical protein [Methanoregula sp.]